MFRFLVISMLCLGALVPGRSQPAVAAAKAVRPNLAGTWQGLLYQPNGPWDRYLFTLEVQGQDSTFTGFSRIQVPGTAHFGLMSIKGRLTSKGLSFDELEILEENLPTPGETAIVWCLKHAEGMVYDVRTDTLAGPWAGCDVNQGTALLRRTGAASAPGQGQAPGGWADLLPITFQQGQSSLRRPAADPALAKVRDLFDGNPSARVRILGHTDDRENRSGNVKLSVQRAQAVAAALQEMGIPAERMIVQGCGSAHPWQHNDDPDGRARNRRVEIILD